MTDLRIVSPAALADDLRASLTVPAEVIGVKSETGQEMLDAVASADVLFGGTFKAEWAPVAGRVRLIQAAGAGIDAIDLSAVPAGCIVANVYGHEYGIAEHAFMVMAAMNRELFAFDRGLRQGLWGSGRPVRELRGRSLLIVGLGRIGREVARWGRFLGMRVSAVTQHPNAERRQSSDLDVLGSLADLPVLARDADFVVICIPHTDETTGLFGERVLSGMKPTAYLVNVGRGPVIDQWAVYNALRDGRLAGAAIDVWYQYPDGDGPQLPSDAPFHELPNTILTPHNAGYTEGTMRHRWVAIAENIRRLLAGEPLENVVWPKG